LLDSLDGFKHDSLVLFLSLEKVFFVILISGHRNGIVISSFIVRMGQLGWLRNLIIILDRILLVHDWSFILGKLLGGLGLLFRGDVTLLFLSWLSWDMRGSFLLLELQLFCFLLS
jgi:hypothetical protein